MDANAGIIESELMECSGKSDNDFILICFYQLKLLCCGMIYLTVTQIDGYSPDVQKARMKAYADFNDYEIVCK